MVSTSASWMMPSLTLRVSLQAPCWGAHQPTAVAEPRDVPDLSGQHPLSLFRDGSWAVVRSLGDDAHLLYFFGNIHRGISFRDMVDAFVSYGPPGGRLFRHSIVAQNPPRGNRFQKNSLAASAYLPARQGVGVSGKQRPFLRRSLQFSTMWKTGGIISSLKMQEYRHNSFQIARSSQKKCRILCKKASFQSGT